MAAHARLKNKLTEDEKYDKPNEMAQFWLWNFLDFLVSFFIKYIEKNTIFMIFQDDVYHILPTQLPDMS